MIRYAVLAMLFLSTFPGCGDLGSIPPLDDSKDDQQITGKFVVDFFAVQCTVKVNPGNGSLRACFPWILNYHFEGRSGSIDRIAFVPVGFMATDLFLDPLRPDSMDRPYSLGPAFWTNSTLPGMDSVLVQLRVEGVYWDRVDGSRRSLGSFDWVVEQKIQVRRP